MWTARIAAALLVAAALAAPATASAASWQAVTSVSHAAGLAIDPRGPAAAAKWAYTLNYAAKRVVKLGTGGRRLRSWSYSAPTPYQTPGGIAVGSSGNVFVADAANGRVLKYDPFGRQLAAFGNLAFPVAVALDRAGNIYVAEQNALDVVKLSSAGAVLARWHIPWANGAGSGLPDAVAVDRQGNVYVGVRCYRDECPPPHGIQSAVIKLNAAGVMQSNLLGNNPYTGISKEEEPFVTVDALALDARNTLYVGGTVRTSGGSMSEGILVYGRGTDLSARYRLPGNGAPGGIAFDGRNLLYVAQDNRVLKRVP